MNEKRKLIEVRNITKKHTLKIRPQQELWKAIGGPFKYLVRKDPNEFTALDNFSLDLYESDALGVIGPNGAGKSTLLKMLAGVSTPEEGTIKTFGRIRSLLELGIGFHPELSGRQNIYLYGSVLGMTRKDIDDHYDEMVEFSELGEFLKMPVKNYSSGMYARLAFSVAIFTAPEIILVDEVLAVGDLQFQEKCINKIHQLRDAGVTIVFVSHGMESVKRVCNRVILLDKGKILADGDPDQAIAEYRSLMKVGVMS